VIHWRIWKLLKYLLAFGLLAYVVYANWDPPSGSGLKDVWQAHVVDRRPIDGSSFVAAFILYWISLLATLYRWHVLVRAQDLPVTLSATLRIGLLGFFFNTFLPGSVGGDLVKAAAVAREQSRRTAAVATVIMDRVIGLWSLIFFVALIGGTCWLFGLFDGATANPSTVIVTAAAVAVAISLSGWMLMGLAPKSVAERFVNKLARIPKIGGMAAEFWRVIWMYRSRPGSVAAAIGLSWISNVGFVLAFYFCGLTLWNGLPSNPLPSLAQQFLIVPLGFMIGAIPLFPGGAGISEAGFGGIYALFGSAAYNGVLASLVNRLLSWIIGVLGYVACQCVRIEQALPIRTEPAGELQPINQETPMAVKDGLVPE
jgi:glycosyltransferase 2 family protein